VFSTVQESRRYGRRNAKNADNFVKERKNKLVKKLWLLLWKKELKLWRNRKFRKKRRILKCLIYRKWLMRSWLKYRLLERLNRERLMRYRNN
jgi:hypothetical protein